MQRLQQVPRETTETKHGAGGKQLGGTQKDQFPFPHHSVSTKGSNYHYVSSVMLLRDQEPAWGEEEQLRISLEVLSHASLGDQSTACEMGGLLLRNGCGVLGRGGMHFLLFFFLVLFFHVF